MSTVPSKPPAPQPTGRTDTAHRRMLTATAITTILIGSSATAAVSGASASPRPDPPATHADRVRRPVIASKQG